MFIIIETRDFFVNDPIGFLECFKDCVAHKEVNLIIGDN